MIIRGTAQSGMTTNNNSRNSQSKNNNKQEEQHHQYNERGQRCWKDQRQKGRHAVIETARNVGEQNKQFDRGSHTLKKRLERSSDKIFQHVSRELLKATTTGNKCGLGLAASELDNRE